MEKEEKGTEPNPHADKSIYELNAMRGEAGAPYIGLVYKQQEMIKKPDPVKK